MATGIRGIATVVTGYGPAVARQSPRYRDRREAVIAGVRGDGRCGHNQLDADESPVVGLFHNASRWWTPKRCNHR